MRFSASWDTIVTISFRVASAGRTLTPPEWRDA